ncbi:MAG: hypothetical protein FD170_758 [Bacteroidetes bacterium]|nr:MAG: hypothetical protein FD170_758 [Bacteroidota bacterium]
MMKMKRKKALIISLILLSILTYSGFKYFLFIDYYKPTGSFYFSSIPIMLNHYYTYSQEQNQKISKDSFYCFLDSYLSDSIYEHHFPTIHFLFKQESRIRLIHYPDSNVIVLYDIGSDRKDDSLKNKVFEDSLPFLYPIIGYKGDILLGYIKPPSIMDLPLLDNEFFKKGTRIRSLKMDSILTNEISSQVRAILQQRSYRNDSILLLIELSYLTTSKEWKGNVLFNGNNTKPEYYEDILDLYEAGLAIKNFSNDADSIVIMLRYPEYWQ